MARLTASPPSPRLHAALDRLKRRERAEAGGVGEYAGARPSAAFMAALDSQTGYPDWTREDNPAPEAGGGWEEPR